MKISIRQKLKLRKILKDNRGKIVLQKGPLGHYWFDATENIAFEDLKLPNDFTYKRRLYSDNGGGQFLIIDNKDQELGRINTNYGRNK